MKKLRKRLFTMVSVGVIDDPLNRSYDIISITALVINIAGTVASTFDPIARRYGPILSAVESITVLFFLIDYILRILTAQEEYPNKKPSRAVLAYILSFTGIIDLISFLPYFLPVFFPTGAVAFKMFRVARIMRLFRINAYYDSMNAITEVIISKKQQLL
ncbi:MAG: ion transporter, partial [Lachnospiraceae bacterium]|nr:ion transporter [Lachnospiraceae bacterium]